MGTTYNIILQSEDESIKNDVNKLLVEINRAVSTYEKESLISLFNYNFDSFEQAYVKSDDLAVYFRENLELSLQINKATKGAFEPTVMPLVNYWGFGYDGRNRIEKVDSTEITRRLNNVGIEQIEITKDRISKTNLQVELDFSGIAKGYASDKIGAYLESKGIDNYYVEIGGELFAKGVNSNGLLWRTGINVPDVNSSVTDFQKIIEISNKGIATSGNYRNYYKTEDGRMYSHTINPKTGYPERNSLLSATIITDNCATADGYSTASMVLGFEEAKKLILANEKIEGVLIYNDENGELQTFDSLNK